MSFALGRPWLSYIFLLSDLRENFVEERARLRLVVSGGWRLGRARYRKVNQSKVSMRH